MWGDMTDPVGGIHPVDHYDAAVTPSLRGAPYPDSTVRAAPPPTAPAIKEELRVKGEFRISDSECHSRSAFMTYKPATTILTNLQRGNVQAEITSVEPALITLHQRAGMGDLVVDDLLQVNDVDAVDEIGYTPLMWTAAYGQLPTIRILLDHGADPNRLGPDGESALMLAACGGHFEIVRLLINADVAVNINDENGNTALMFAAHSNSAHTVHELLTAGADVTATNVNGESPLSITVTHCCHFAQSVLEKHMMSKVFPNVRDFAVDSAERLAEANR